MYNFAIDKVIRDVLGDKVTVINSYLSRYALTLDDIYNEPEEIRAAIYNVFGEDAYRIEREIINNLLVRSSNLTHAVELLNVYRKVGKCNSRSLYDILELIELEAPKYCKSCNSIIDSSRCRYESILTGLCSKCYNLHNEMVNNLIEEGL